MFKNRPIQRGITVHRVHPNGQIDPKWPRGRRWLALMLSSKRFETIVGLAVMWTLVLVVQETNIEAKPGAEVPRWHTLNQQVLLFFYAFELLAKLVAFRLAFFRSQINAFDLVTIVTDVFFHIFSWVFGRLPSFSFLRVLRILRAARFLRAVRTLSIFKDLYLMVHGFVIAMQAIFWATVLLFMVLMLFAIFAVQFIHPLNVEISKTGIYDGCARCPRAFASVEAATLTFVQQVVAGDSWGAVTIPIMEEHPWTSVFFFSVLVSVVLGLMNLVVIVIVDGATQAQETDKQELQLEMMARQQGHKERMHDICKQLDTDQSGTLTKAEFMQGYDHNDALREVMKHMDIKRTDVDTMFNIIGCGETGSVDYSDFVEELHRMKHEDNRTLLVYVQSHVKDIQAKVTAEMKMIRNLLEAGGYQNLEVYPSMTQASLPPSVSRRTSARRPTDCSVATCNRTEKNETLSVIFSDGSLVADKRCCESPPNLGNNMCTELRKALQQLQAQIAETLAKVACDVDVSMTRLLDDGRPQAPLAADRCSQPSSMTAGSRIHDGSQQDFATQLCPSVVPMPAGVASVLEPKLPLRDGRQGRLSM